MQGSVQRYLNKLEMCSLVHGSRFLVLPLLENRRSQCMHVVYRERRAKLPKTQTHTPSYIIKIPPDLELIEIQYNPNLQIPLLKLAYRFVYPNISPLECGLRWFMGGLQNKACNTILLNVVCGGFMGGLHNKACNTIILNVLCCCFMGGLRWFGVVCGNSMDRIKSAAFN